MLTEYYFAVRYGDIIILLYHEDMMSVWELLFKNSQKEKALKRFLEYCYMIDVKVAFEAAGGSTLTLLPLFPRISPVSLFLSLLSWLLYLDG